MGICRAVTSLGLPLGICTNATQTTDAQIAELAALGGVHLNVSFDGFRPDSHGRFRGSTSSFATTKATTEKLAAAGEVAVCLYLVFAARTPASRYADTDFLVGNILEGEVAGALDAYDFHRRFVVGSNLTCWSCELNTRCGKGCPAAVVADGHHIGTVEREQCPVPAVPGQAPLLQIGRRPA
jgi:radical SAM protein with 4Fe4S-binding SPASM domain